MWAREGLLTDPRETHCSKGFFDQICQAPVLVHFVRHRTFTLPSPSSVLLKILGREGRGEEVGGELKTDITTTRICSSSCRRRRRRRRYCCCCSIVCSIMINTR